MPGAGRALPGGTQVRTRREWQWPHWTPCGRNLPGCPEPGERAGRARAPAPEVASSPVQVGRPASGPGLCL